MTLTASRPAEPTHQPGAPTEVTLVVPELPFTTSDHKRLGRYYLVASTLFVLVSAVIGVLIELQLSSKGASIVGNDYDRLFNLHSTAGAVLFLPAVWIGLGTYLVPLQIGARRLAFPRLAALAFWSYVVGGALLLLSYLGTARGAGIASNLPLPVAKGTSHATDLWAASLFFITLATVMAAATLFVTILKLRVEGMTMARLPAFSWSILAVSAATLLSAPLFLAGMLLVYLDQHFHAGLFAAKQVNANLVWQHLVWLYGRPDVFLPAVPCLGALCDVVATHARRPLLQPMVAKGLIFAAAVCSFAILTAGAAAERSVLLPTPTVVSVAIGIPIGLCALLWLGTIRPNDLRFHVSLLYVAGFLLFLVAGAVNAAIAPSQHLAGGPSGSEWTAGQVHAVLFAAPTLALFGAIYHWSPKIWGRALNQLVGVVQWLLLVAGFLATSLGAWLAGYDGAPWHVSTYAQAKASHYFDYAKLSTAGGVLVVLGLLVFLANAAMSFAGARRSGAERPADPYEASTLEWATTSPPPDDNFDVVPEVRSDAPLADARLRKMPDPAEATA